MVDIAKKGLPLGYSYMIGQGVLHYNPTYDFYAECKSVTLAELSAYYQKGGTANYAEGLVATTQFGGKAAVRWLAEGWKDTSNTSREAVVYRVASALDGPLHYEGRALNAMSAQEMMSTSDFEMGAARYPADSMARAVDLMRSIFVEQGYLPHDNVWTPRDLQGVSDVTSVLPPLQMSSSTGQRDFYTFKNLQSGEAFNPTALRIVWFYATDIAALETGAAETQRNRFFSRCFVVMGCTGDPATASWYPANTTSDQEGLFRQYGASNNLPIAFPQSAAPYKVDQSLSRWAQSNEETIADAAVVISELVITAATAGAALPFIQIVNPFILGMVHAACTGDGEMMQRAITGIYQQFAAQIELKQSAILDDLAQNHPDTAAFFGKVTTIVGEVEDKATGMVKSLRTTVDGVGYTMGDIVQKGQKVLLDDLKKVGTLDPSASIGDLVTTIDKRTGLSLSSGTGLGVSMLKATYQKAASEITKAVTDDVSKVVRQTQGVLGWAHDIGQSIDFKTIAKQIPTSSWPIKVVDPKTGEVAFTNTKALDDAFQAAVKGVLDGQGVPRYAEQAVFYGASFKLLNTIQKQEFEPEVQFRTYKQAVTEYKSGFVPPELVAAYKAQGLTVKTQKADVSPNLANLNGKGVSGGMTKVGTRTMKAANAGVTFNEVGAATWQVALGAVATAGALYFARKKGGYAIPNAAIAAGSGLAALAVWYGLRNTIHGKPLLVPAVAAGSTLKIEGAQTPMGLGVSAPSGAPVTYTRTTSAGYGVEAPSGASMAPSTDNLVLLSDPAHQFTVAEVQYLLGLYGAVPKVPVTGQWSDDMVKAVRDWQTKIFKQDPWSNLVDVNGDPFDPKSSTQLRKFALQKLLDPKHIITVGEAQALLQVPITGKEDAATKAKMAKSAITTPIASAATQAWLRNLASGATQYGGGYF